MKNHAKLIGFISEILNDQSFVDRSGNDSKSFTRDRVWTFSTTFLFICNILNKRAQSEIDGFLSQLFGTPASVRHATASSFTKRRGKIKPGAFSEMSRKLVEKFYNTFRYNRFKGFRVLAVDGSAYTLPRTDCTVRAFGDNVFGNGKWIKAQVSMLSDVLNNICIEQVMDAYTESEAKLATGHLAHAGKSDLLLFDRGYFSFAFLREVALTGAAFCFRMRTNACKALTVFVEGKEPDARTVIQVDGMDITVRFTKIDLGNGQTEYLMTNLYNRSRFTPQVLKGPYHKRWGIEEQFKDFKHAIAIGNFVGRKKDHILQEFHANSLIYNLSMMIRAPLVTKCLKGKKRRHSYKNNKRATLSQFKASMTDLFNGSMEKVVQTMKNIISNLIQEAVPIRNGRKYERGKTQKAKRKHARQYVPV